MSEGVSFPVTVTGLREAIRDTERLIRALEKENDAIIDEICEASGDSASYYNIDRLGYLNVNNEDDIADIMHEYGERSISVACAIWYDRQVEHGALIIRDWVESND